LGREVTEGAVLRAITELWQQLRIIPVVSAPGKPAQWQLLRIRFQKAIAEGASTSQVTAISVLASIYLQAVIAASMEEVELFLAPLTARSKVREVLRGLVATRQVHTISLGHAPQFYVAGTLPEFAVAPTLYTSSSMPASAYFLHSHEEEMPEPIVHQPAPAASIPPVDAPRKAAEQHTLRTPATRRPAAAGKPGTARPHFSRPATQSRDRKPAQSSTSSRPARRAGSETRASSTRPAGARPSTGSRPASSARWTPDSAKSTNGKRNDTHKNGASSNGARSNGNASRPANSSATPRSAKSQAPSAWSQRNGHTNGAKTTGKLGASPRSSSVSRNGASARKEARPAGRKPALAAGTKAGNSKQYNYAARPKQGTKKRG
jgi:hypothetical protein